MERVKFLAIFSSNLDEFFEIRVAGIKQQIENQISDVGPDGLSSVEIFDAIQRRVHDLVAQQHRVWNLDIIPKLEENNIRFHEAHSLSKEDMEWAHQYFLSEVFPVLTPLAVDPSHPFPQLLNKSCNLILQLRKPRKTDQLMAVVQMPQVLPPLIRIPRKESESHLLDFVFLDSMIRAFCGDLFPGLKLEGAYAFRVTRNSDLYIDEEEAQNLLRTIEKELRKRNKGNAVRLELQENCPLEVQNFLLETFRLKQEDLYKGGSPLNMLHLFPLCSNDAFARLRDRPFIPSFDQALPPNADIFEVVRRQDVLLHHPYESFDSVVNLVECAARDPQVLAIKMTLYRTSPDSPLITSMIEAAQNGKQVTVIMELKARFDEENNIQWARRLEEAGVHVLYGVVGLKTHCKAILIVRRDEDRIRHYVHLGTGNYHPKTARMYTDLSLITASKDLTQEVATLFNALTGLAEYPGFKKLLVAPFDMAQRFKQMIDHERDLALKGRPGRIITKVNALVDEDIIKSLYEASCAGVKIDLIIRGVCCLRPSIPGVSENIRVISIVGRFLEHSRVYYFGNDGAPLVYLGSADWMPRNFHRRIEICFPVEDHELKKQIEEEILPAYLKDCVKSRELKADGSYVRLKPNKGEKPFQAQFTFREMSRQQQQFLAAKSANTGLPRPVPQGKSAEVRPR